MLRHVSWEKGSLCTTSFQDFVEQRHDVEESPSYRPRAQSKQVHSVLSSWFSSVPPHLCNVAFGYEDMSRGGRGGLVVLGEYQVSDRAALMSGFPLRVFLYGL